MAIAVLAKLQGSVERLNKTLSYSCCPVCRRWTLVAQRRMAESQLPALNRKTGSKRSIVNIRILQHLATLRLYRPIRVEISKMEAGNVLL